MLKSEGEKNCLGDRQDGGGPWQIGGILGKEGVDAGGEIRYGIVAFRDFARG
jgi:hypothetical protein